MEGSGFSLFMIVYFNAAVSNMLKSYVLALMLIPFVFFPNNATVGVGTKLFPPE